MTPSNSTPYGATSTGVDGDASSVANGHHDGPIRGLIFPQHEKLLRESRIADAVATARGYRSTDNPSDLLRLGFQPEQCMVPALVIPVWNIDGQIAFHQIRPDDPRPDGDGKPIKYDRPQGTVMTLDVSPWMPREWLGDPTRPLIWTEGSRKVDAAVSRGHCCIGLLGVWGFIGTNANGGKTALADLRHIAHSGRLEYIAFDSDAITKAGVYQAQLELGAELRRRGATVRYCVIPPGPSGEKQGIDDFIASGGSVEQLLADATIEPPKPNAIRDRLDRADFVAHLPTHRYVYLHTNELWPSTSVNNTVPPVAVGVNSDGTTKWEKASDWLDRHQAVQQMTWAPGEARIIEGRLLNDGGWLDQHDARALNTYRPPTIELGDPEQVGPWLDHVHTLYPEDAAQLIAWLAHRVQRPGEKLNHALVLGGKQGIGKDSLLAPAIEGVGTWNAKEVMPSQAVGRFNGFLKSVILRVSEMRDAGEVNRYTFYEHMKTYIAAPPEVLRCDEKHVSEYAIPNVCGVVFTTNNKTTGLYLPPDDRRHYVAWSDRQPADIPRGYFDRFHHWLRDEDGIRNVAAYLHAYDLSDFNPKAPPPKTPAFWDIVDANQAPEDTEISDVLDSLGNPEAVTIQQIIAGANLALTSFQRTTSGAAPLAEWLQDRRNARQIAHRMSSADYVKVRSTTGDGAWKIHGKRMQIYAKQALSTREQHAAAERLAEALRDERRRA